MEKLKYELNPVGGVLRGVSNISCSPQYSRSAYSYKDTLVLKNGVADSFGFRPILKSENK